MAPIRGCTIEIVNAKDKPFQFVAKHSSRGPLYLAAEDEKMMKRKD
jgi:hypothetical protein